MPRSAPPGGLGALLDGAFVVARGCYASPMPDDLIVNTAIACLTRELPPGPTWSPTLANQVNADLLERGVSVSAERLVELLAREPRVLVEYRDGDATPWVRLRSAVTDEDTRARLVEILIEARSFDELAESITGEYAANPRPVYGYALRFLAEGKPNGLEEPLQETFAHALARFDDTPRALELAGVLRAHLDARR